MGETAVSEGARRLFAETAQAIEIRDERDMRDQRWREFVVAAALLVDSERYGGAVWREMAAFVTGMPCEARGRAGAIFWMRDH